ncbi:MAG TPA: sigma-54 dependent transcriptional regulator [Chryseosolibacter sp.]|nr:sigma-54 dependent transcriptional regulator [Chryseosolibacter sp.]
MAKIPAAILIVDDDADIVTAARVVLRQRFETVVTENNPERLKTLLHQRQFDVILLDMNFRAGNTSGNEGLYWLREILQMRPGQHVIMITAYGDIKTAVEAMKHGAADFVVKPWENEKLEATVMAAFQHAQTRKELQTLKKKQQQFTELHNTPEATLIGSGAGMKTVFTVVEKVATTDANILLLGENGTGKEIVARHIHNVSHRRNQPFVKVDLGSLSQGLFESELFGHRKGSFTDAREDRIGRFELASGGTLFLDEVANLSIALQSKLLSVLQNREVIPLGASLPVPVDIRLICATNINIHESVSAGGFREDLLYRINTVEIQLPPLRERTEDIPPLVAYFIDMYCHKYRKEKKSISDDAIRYLQAYRWPGNVRELQHAVERAVIMSDETRLQKHDFLFDTRKNQLEKKDDLKLDEMERRAILFAIQKFKGNMSKVAKELGVGRTTLYRKMTKYGIDK